MAIRSNRAENTSLLADSSSALEIEERRQALRQLLKTPLLYCSKETEEIYRLIRRHGAWLEAWFAKHPKWLLSYGRNCARLLKIAPLPPRVVRGACDRQSNTEFTKRHYTLVFLALAVLEQDRSQITLDRLARQIVSRAKLLRVTAEVSEDGVRESFLELQNRSHRRELVLAIRLLVEYGVITRVDGSEQEYISEQRDVLYTIHRTSLAYFLCVRQSPSLVTGESVEERCSNLILEQMIEGEDPQNEQNRMMFFRRFLEEPVVYYADLSEAEREYIVRQRHSIIKIIEEATGFVAEVRAEGIAFLDERGEATDIRFPEDGTNGHVALLLVEYLTNELRQSQDCKCSVMQLEQFIAGEAEHYKKSWRKDALQPGAERELVARALSQLAALRMIEWRETIVTPMPCIARYSLSLSVGSEKQKKESNPQLTLL